MADDRNWSRAKVRLAVDPRDQQANLELEQLFRACMQEMGMTDNQFANYLMEVRNFLFNGPNSKLEDLRSFIELFKKMLARGLTLNLVS